MLERTSKVWAQHNNADLTRCFSAVDGKGYVIAAVRCTQAAVHAVRCCQAVESAARQRCTACSGSPRDIDQHAGSRQVQ